MTDRKLFCEHGTPAEERCFGCEMLAGYEPFHTLPPGIRLRSAAMRIERWFGLGKEQADSALRSNVEAKRIYDCAVRAVMEVEDQIRFLRAYASNVAPADYDGLIRIELTQDQCSLLDACVAEARDRVGSADPGLNITLEELAIRLKDQILPQLGAKS